MGSCALVVQVCWYDHCIAGQNSPLSWPDHKNKAHKYYMAVTHLKLLRNGFHISGYQQVPHVKSDFGKHQFFLPKVTQNLVNFKKKERLLNTFHFFYYSTFPMRDRICQPPTRVLKHYPQCCSFVAATVAEH